LSIAVVMGIFQVPVHERIAILVTAAIAFSMSSAMKD
jgi:hypothetical protein